MNFGGSNGGSSEQFRQSDGILEREKERGDKRVFRAL
jgi:hypothetical protein